MPDFRQQYLDATEREENVRIVSFLGLSESIAGIECDSMTCTHLAVLAGIRSPFICGDGVPTAGDIATFLWVLQPGWKPGLSPERTDFFRKARMIDYVAGCKAIDTYLEETFIDGLPKRETATKMTKAYVSWIAIVVDELASEYHWSESDILRTPLKRLWQYRRCIRLRRDPKAAMFNKSDRVIGDYIDSLNAKEDKRDGVR